MKNFLLAFILGTLPFLATGKPIPAITDSLGNRIYNLNAITIISNPKWDSKLFEFPGSISYLNTGNLDEMNIRSVKDISTVVPVPVPEKSMPHSLQYDKAKSTIWHPL